MFTKARKYLKYILRHKYYVFIECCKLGIPLRGLMHDISKLAPSEWFPYANYFYGSYPSLKNFHGSEVECGAPFPTFQEDIDEEFDIAWLKHQHRNKHHWQYWLLHNEDGSAVALKMPLKYTKEMLADWRGAGMAINGCDDTVDWYLANRKKMTLHINTRNWIENELMGMK